jgi:hypothetical protein
MAGAKATMQRQDVLSHNLANASTTGFRAEMAAFRAVPVRGDGASTRAYALETTIGYDDRGGPVQTTGRDLDVAMQGRAWLAVQGRTAPRPTPVPVRWRSTPKAPWSPPTAAPWWATAAPSRCRPARGWTSPPTAWSAPRWATAARRPWAG